MYAEPTSCASFVGNFNIEEIQNQYLCTLPFPDITTEIPYPRNRTWQENDGWGNKWSMVWHCTFTFYQFFIRPRRRKNSCNKYSKLQKSLKAVENWSLNNHFLAETSCLSFYLLSLLSHLPCLSVLSLSCLFWFHKCFEKERVLTSGHGCEILSKLGWILKSDRNCQIW